MLTRKNALSLRPRWAQVVVPDDNPTGSRELVVASDNEWDDDEDQSHLIFELQSHQLLLLLLSFSRTTRVRAQRIKLHFIRIRLIGMRIGRTMTSTIMSGKGPVSSTVFSEM